MLHLERSSCILPSMMSLSTDLVMPMVSALDHISLSPVHESSSPSLTQGEDMITDKEQPGGSQQHDEPEVSLSLYPTTELKYSSFLC